MREELELFQPTLAAKPQIVAANKMDAVSDDDARCAALEARAPGARTCRSSGSRPRPAPALPGLLEAAWRMLAVRAPCGGRPIRHRNRRWLTVDERPVTTRRDSRRHVRSHSLRPPRPRPRRGAMLSLTRMFVIPAHMCRRIGRSVRVGVSSLRHGVTRGRRPARIGARPISSCARRALVHGADASAVPRARLPAVGAVFHHRRRRVRRDRQLARLPADPRLGALRGRLAAGPPGWCAAATAAGAGVAHGRSRPSSRWPRWTR